MATHVQQSGGQKTFRLARLFHTEDCYRARALTAEELVRRTFIGVDAETFKKLHRKDSYYDVTSCEDWHARFAERFQDAPTCEDIARAAERLGYRVRKVRGKERDHFYFLGARQLESSGYFVASRCVGCKCQCDHDAERPGAGCESCDCACVGCYCAGGCASSHADAVDDTEDPLMNLAVTDANFHHRSRRFKIKKPYRQRWHTDDCKNRLSFTADELVELTLKPSREGVVENARYSDWVSRFDYHFENLPTNRELADALMRQGIRVGGPANIDPLTGKPNIDRLHGLRVLIFDDAFWLRSPFNRCGDQPCECLCKLCEPTGCSTCDCQCHGCICTGTCADGHPVVQRASDPSLTQAWRKLATDRGKKRYEPWKARYEMSWHARDCTTVRWLTTDQIVRLKLVDASEISEGGWSVPQRCNKPYSGTRCGLPSINEILSDFTGPSCSEVADSARRIGIRVGPLPKRWPWERTHFKVVGVEVGDRLRLESEPSCTGCQCFCPLCDDCSNCPCACSGCVCGARCSTGECATVHEVISNRPRHVSEIERRLGTKRNMSLEDLEVSEALFRIEQGDITNQGRDGELIGDDAPRFELRRKARWHRDGCEHPGLTLTALEIAYATLKRISEETMRDNQRFGLPMEHANCELWRHEFLAFSGPEPECELFVAAVKRLGYEVKPVEGKAIFYSYYDGEVHVSGEDEIHYEFPNADKDLRLWIPFERLVVPDWDEARCDGRCECGCSHLQWFGRCECVGCYCPKTCVPARSEE